METELDLYLLERAFDNLQYLITGNPCNLLEQKSSRDLTKFYQNCLDQQINPIWAMANTFDRHVFLNRKRVKIPVMLPAMLNQINMKRAVNSATKYQTYKHNQEVQHNPWLKTILLIGLKTYFNIPYQTLVKDTKEQMDKLVNDFKTYPYFDPRLERLRKHCLEVNQGAYLWHTIFLIEGATSIFTPALLLGSEPTKSLFKLTPREYPTFMQGLANPSEKQYDYYNLHYLKLAVNKIKEMKGLI